MNHAHTGKLPHDLEAPLRTRVVDNENGHPGYACQRLDARTEVLATVVRNDDNVYREHRDVLPVTCIPAIVCPFIALLPPEHERTKHTGFSCKSEISGRSTRMLRPRPKSAVRRTKPASGRLKA